MDGTVDAFFHTAISRYGDRPFIRCLWHPLRRGERRWSYREGARVVATTLEDLRRCGVERGEYVMLYLDEPLPSLFFSLACMHLGAVPVPLSASSSPAALTRLAGMVGARYALTLAEHAPSVAAVGAAVGLRPLVYDDGAVPAQGCALRMTPEMSFEQARAMLEEASSSGAGGGRRPEDVYVVQPTSGTTGAPKLILRPHRAVARSAVVKAEGLDPARLPAERVLLVNALTHGAGQYLAAMAIYLGAELLIPSGINMQTSLEEVRLLDPTYVALAPRVLRELLRQRAAADDDKPLFGPSARTYWTGGSATEPALLAALHEQKLEVMECYGASEFGLIAITKRGDWREGLVGKILPDVTVRIADDGEILTRTPAMMLGYFGDEALTRAAFTEDGLFRTGDYGELTPDGYLRYTGRKKDVFNTSEGTNIHPTRLEEMLEQLPWVEQAILVGDQRPYLGALLVVRDAKGSPQQRGPLPASAHAQLYARAQADVGRLNEGLEEIERVRRVALFAGSFPEDVYKLAGHQKVNRNRAAVASTFADTITRFYSKPPAIPEEVV